MITRKTTLEEIRKIVHPCKCNECNNGCKYGSGCFTDAQLPRLAEFLRTTVEKLKGKYLESISKFNTTLWRPKIKKNKYGYGPCIFFHESKGCKIHKVKPLECETAMSCSEHGKKLSLWFNLNHFLNENDPESIRQYISYLKAGGETLPHASVGELIPDRNKLKKIINYEIMR